MIRAFLLLLTSAAGFWFLADSLKQKGPGFVWIYFDHYSLETSFWFFCLLLILLVIALYIAVRLVGILAFFAFRAGLLPQKWGENRYQVIRTRAEIAYSEKNWAEALLNFQKAIKKNAVFSDVIMAARAALEVQDISAAQNLYEVAKECSDMSELSLGLLQLDISIAKKDDGLSREVISRLQASFPRNHLLAAKAFVFYCQSYRWKKAARFLALAKKSTLLTAMQLQSFEQSLYLALLKEARRNHDLNQLEKNYKQAKSLVANSSEYFSEAAANYLAALLEINELVKAEKFFKKLLKQNNFKALDNCLADLSLQHNDKLGHWLVLLQSVEETNSDNSSLLQLLAKLCERLNRKEDAISYYESSLVIAFNKSNILALIALCFEQSKQEKAKKYIALLSDHS